jgi:hypothetical protein
MIRRKCRRFLKRVVRRQLAAPLHVVETAYALPFCRMTSRLGFLPAAKPTRLWTFESFSRIYFADMARKIKAYFYNAQNRGIKSQNTHNISKSIPNNGLRAVRSLRGTARCVLPDLFASRRRLVLHCSRWDSLLNQSRSPSGLLASFHAAPVRRLARGLGARRPCDGGELDMSNSAFVLPNR